MYRFLIYIYKHLFDVFRRVRSRGERKTCVRCVFNGTFLWWKTLIFSCFVVAVSGISLTIIILYRHYYLSIWYLCVRASGYLEIKYSFASTRFVEKRIKLRFKHVSEARRITNDETPRARFVWPKPLRSWWKWHDCLGVYPWWFQVAPAREKNYL